MDLNNLTHPDMMNNGSAGANGTMYHGEDFSMPTYAQVVMILMYTTITVLAVGGNSIVVYIVLAYQRMRTVTNYFIVNLSLSDIIMSCICIPFTFIANMLVHYWPFGAIMCPLVTYAQAVAVFLSAFTLVAISLDRYVAIIYPLRPRMTTNQAALSIFLIWFLSLAVPLPIAIVSKVSPMEQPNGIIRDQCTENWERAEQRQVFSVIIMVLQYFLPLFVLLFTYTRIAIVIWVKRTPGEAENNRDQRMAASKRKVRLGVSSKIKVRNEIVCIVLIYHIHRDNGNNAQKICSCTGSAHWTAACGQFMILSNKKS